MSNIAEKLTTIAENQQKVYDAGKQAERIALWEAMQNSGKRTHYACAFNSEYWTDENFTPLYPIKTDADATSMFEECKITDFTKEGVVLDFSACTTLKNLFRNTKNTEIKLPTLDFSKVVYATYAFENYWGKDVSLIISEQFGGVNSFPKCYYLENVTISGTFGKHIAFKDSNLLSAESVQNIIDCLKDLTGATAQTITFHAEVKAKLTDEQKATITAKNWTLG